jgi:predicted ribosomally synthesized peptide with SipW-like signal peptide
MKKKILAIVLCIAMLAIAIVGGTMAYFTDTDAKTNTFTVGNVSIVLTEPNWDATGAAEAADAYPGEALAKDPTVTNDGHNPCFVRVKVEGLDQFAQTFNGAMIKYRTDYVDGKLGTDWVAHSDGYFYYTKILKPNEKTPNLIEKVKTDFKNIDNINDFDIVVYTESVQTTEIDQNGRQYTADDWQEAWRSFLSLSQ